MYLIVLFQIYYVFFPGRFGPRTKDPNYYFFKSPMFHISWPTKYVKVFLVYNKDFVSIVGQKISLLIFFNAKKKPMEHFSEGISHQTFWSIFDVRSKFL